MNEIVLQIYNNVFTPVRNVIFTFLESNAPLLMEIWKDLYETAKTIMKFRYQLRIAWLALMLPVVLFGYLRKGRWL